MEEKYSFEHLQKEINLKSKQEKIATIKNKIEVFNEWKYEKDRDYTWQIFSPGFLEKAEELLKQIEGDTSIAYDYDWNWFFNADNIGNQDAVFETKDFIEKHRYEVFDSLYFFNLLFKQKHELEGSLNKPVDFVNSLKELPLDKLQKHILLGFLLFWHGGYPVQNGNAKYKTILMLIEREFLALFPNEKTPEMEFCKYKPVYIDKQEAMIMEWNRAIRASQKTEDQSKPESETNELKLNTFSNSQLVLIFYYFFKQNGLTPRENIDVAPIAKFIHLITGKEFTRTTNSDFYNKLKTVPNFKTDGELIKDLEKVKPFFEKVQLNEIVKMIESEVDIARQEVNKQRKGKK